MYYDTLCRGSIIETASQQYDPKNARCAKKGGTNTLLVPHSSYLLRTKHDKKGK